MTTMDLEQLVSRVIDELRGAAPAVVTTPTAAADASAASPGTAATLTHTAPLPPASDASRGERTVDTSGELVIDLPDPTEEFFRTHIGVTNPIDRAGLENLRRTTSARLAVGRAGPRPPTWALLLFQADHAVTQDSIYGVVDESLLERHNLFSVRSQNEDRETYLLRPDLGRKLSDEAKAEIDRRCMKGPDVQICIADGLSAAAIENNLDDILPVIEQGLTSAGLSMGTPFFIQNARVGLMNDINEIVRAKVVLMLIGERPGLGIADAMSAYMGYDPQAGKTDADRDLLCMITRHGGTNPLEAGAYIVEVIRTMIKHQASGVRLRELVGED